MKTKEFTNAFGKLENVNSKKWGKYLSFIPTNLPPEIDFNKKLVFALSQADSTLSKLSGISLTLPNPNLLIIPYLRKEALSSSRIEGTQISLENFFLAEAKGEEDNEINASEVINYIRAMNFGLKEIKTKQINLELIKSMHKILMNQVRGKNKFPGEFRKIQNWIGLPNSTPQTASFVPPYPKKIEELLSNMINYMNTFDETPLLIKIALLHYQFETIHPFADGNGRIGRALIVLYLIKKNKLSEPLLYISGFFEKYKKEYSELLLETNKTANFEKWILFFLNAIEKQSEQAIEKSIKMNKLKTEYKKKVQEKYNNNTILEIIDNLFINPFIQISKLTKRLNKSYPTTKRLIENLVNLGIIKQIDNSERNKTYIANEILDLLVYD